MLSDRAKAEARKIGEELIANKGVACTGYMPSRRSRRSKEEVNLAELSFGKKKPFKKRGNYSEAVIATNGDTPEFFDSRENNDNGLFSDNDAGNNSVGLVSAIEEDEEEMMVGVDNEDISYIGASELDNVNTDILEGIVLDC
jgi:hypothetical protein